MEPGDSSRTGATAKQVLLLLFVLMVGVTSAHVVTALGTDAVEQVGGDDAGSGADWLQVTDDGGASNDTAERTLARVGDVNGDGTEDVLIGVPGADAAGREDAGAAYLVPGPVERANASRTDARATFVGERAGDRAGQAVAPAGDLDGDGYDDVLVGAPTAGADGSDAGAAYVVYGGENVTGERNLSTADVTLTGASGDRAGWAVAAAANASPTGTGVIVGAPGWGETDAGAAVLVSNETLANTSTASLASAADARLAGQDAGDRAGHAVAGVRDVNDDGSDDVLVGAHVADNESAATSVDTAYLVYGPANVPGVRSLGDADVTFAGERAGNRTTWSVADGETSRCDDASVAGPLSGEDEETTRATGGAFGALVDCLSDDGERAGNESDAATPDDPSRLTADDGGTGAAAASDTSSDGSVDVGTGSDSADDSAGVSGDANESGNATAGQNSAAGGNPQSEAGSVEVEITCEDPEPYVYNPTDGQVTVTVDGPDGSQTDDLGSGDDVGGVRPPSHQTPSMAPGEYTVTAVDEAGNAIPVNGEASYTTTVKACPTASLATECVDPDTVRVSFRAEHLTGRHDAPVTIRTQSPNASDRWERTVSPSDGVATSEFAVSDDERVGVEVRPGSDVGAGPLARTTVSAGTCDDLAQATETQSGPTAGTEGATETTAPEPTETDADEPQATSTESETDSDDEGDSTDGDGQSATDDAEATPESATESAAGGGPSNETGA